MIADMSCIFCTIAAGDIPATVVYEDDRIMAFRDLNPQAPVHVLVIPKQHLANVVDLSAEPGLASDLLQVAAAVARAEGVEGGFRLVFNTGPDGGQEVDHVHAHVIGGRHMGWPPG